MNVLVATDGSKYGRWGLNWVAKLPFVEPPRVTVLHVLDNTMLSWPFRTRLELQRVEARAAKTLKRAKQQLASLNIKGTAQKEQGEVASVILKRAPDRNGLLVVGTKGLNALDKFLLGSVSTKLSSMRPVRCSSSRVRRSRYGGSHWQQMDRLRQLRLWSLCWASFSRINPAARAGGYRSM